MTSLRYLGYFWPGSINKEIINILQICQNTLPEQLVLTVVGWFFFFFCLICLLVYSSIYTDISAQIKLNCTKWNFFLLKKPRNVYALVYIKKKYYWIVCYFEGKCYKGVVFVHVCVWVCTFMLTWHRSVLASSIGLQEKKYIYIYNLSL